MLTLKLRVCVIIIFTVKGGFSLLNTTLFYNVICLKTSNKVSNFIFKYEISPNGAHQGQLEKRLQYHRVKK